MNDKLQTVADWQWQTRYRVWDANRKVFIYPENWTEPTLRPAPVSRAAVRKIRTVLCRYARRRSHRIMLIGKTRVQALAIAQNLARDLEKDLYRIQLSALVSKYIGETEKNLSRVFAAAKRSDAILFFDEADALFGKRTGVRDSHDRYANIEINYLLEKMEHHDGISMLVAKRRGNIDPAFIRRMQVLITSRRHRK